MYRDKTLLHQHHLSDCIERTRDCLCLREVEIVIVYELDCCLSPDWSCLSTHPYKVREGIENI
jgi:hypothetical protein